MGNPFYPAFLNLKNEPCVVIGGGPVAERKTIGLLEASAKVTVVSPKITGELKELAESGKIIYIPRRYQEGDIDGSRLVIAATDDEQINKEIAREAAKKNVLLNVVDRPELCTFILPSVIKRGDLQIAISTGGQSPALSKYLRKRIEADFGTEYEDWVKIVGEFRRKVNASVKDDNLRRLAYKRLFDSDLFDEVRAHKKVDVDSLIAKFAR